MLYHDLHPHTGEYSVASMSPQTVFCTRLPGSFFISEKLRKKFKPSTCIWPQVFWGKGEEGLEMQESNFDRSTIPYDAMGDYSAFFAKPKEEEPVYEDQDRQKEEDRF